MKNFFKNSLLILFLSSCSSGGVIYDGIFKKEQSPITDARRPANAYQGVPPSGMMNAPMGSMQSPNALADIGNMGIGGPMSQNPYASFQNPSQNLPPVEYASPSAPVYQPPQMQQMSQPTMNISGGYNPQMQGLSPWVGMPNPGYAPQQQQQMQPQYQPPQQPVMYAPQIPQQQIPQIQPIMAQQPPMPPMQMQPPAFSNLQAPTYTTPINMMAMPPQQAPQMPQQYQAIPQAPQQPVYQQPKEDPLKPLSRKSKIKDSLEELKELEEEVAQASRGGREPPPLAEDLYSDRNNDLSEIENPAPSQNSELEEIPVEQVEMQDLLAPENMDPTPLQDTEIASIDEEMDKILSNPKRNMNTPASGIIDTMQGEGLPASLLSINQNIDTLNTPLGFDANGEPVVPASFKKQIKNAPVNQGVYPQFPNSMPAPASQNSPATINSLQQRATNIGI